MMHFGNRIVLISTSLILFLNSSPLFLSGNLTHNMDLSDPRPLWPWTSVPVNPWLSITGSRWDQICVVIAGVPAVEILIDRTYIWFHDGRGRVRLWEVRSNPCLSLRIRIGYWLRMRLLVGSITGSIRFWFLVLGRGGSIGFLP